MSTVYWDMAEESRLSALEEFSERVYSRHVISAIIMYCSSVEALINEQLAVEEGGATDPGLREQLAKLKDSGIKDKIQPAFRFFATIKQNETLSASPLNNFLALAELRNAFVHYKPDWKADLYQWPHRIRSAFERSKLQPVNADWIVNFTTKPVLEWARETTHEMLKEFLRVTREDEKRFFNL